MAFSVQAFMSQQNKKEKEPRIKAICKMYGLKGTVSVDKPTTLILTLYSGPLDFLSNYAATTGKKRECYTQITPHWLENMFTGKALRFLQEVCKVMNEGNRDYGGWFTAINIGKENKPYVLITPAIPMLRVKEASK